MTSLFKIAEPKPKKFVPLDEEYHKPVWKCYSCGKTSEEITFSTYKYWTDYGYEYECCCDSCGSEHTDMDGEGSPLCNCGRSHDWYCDDCGLTCCPECWEWWLTPIEEPEEYECWQCNPPDFVDV